MLKLDGQLAIVGILGSNMPVFGKRHRNELQRKISVPRLGNQGDTGDVGLFGRQRYLSRSRIIPADGKRLPKPIRRSWMEM